MNLLTAVRTPFAGRIDATLPGCAGVARGSSHDETSENDCGSQSGRCSVHPGLGLGNRLSRNAFDLSLIGARLAGSRFGVGPRWRLQRVRNAALEALLGAGFILRGLIGHER